MPNVDSNLGRVLRQLRDHGPRSRATLAAELGLTRTALSTLTADLAERGLVRDGGIERGAVGRPGTSVELDGHAVAGLGAEVNVNHVSTMALDLTGEVVSEHKLALDARAVPAEEVLDRLAELVRETIADLAHRDIEPVGLTVGVAGLVDRERDWLTLGPNLGWHDVPVGELLRARLGDAYPIAVENEGNLAALAEATPGRPPAPGRPRPVRRGRRRRWHRHGRPAAARPTGVRRRVRPHDRRAPGPTLRLWPGRVLGDGGRTAGSPRPRGRPRRPGARSGHGRRRPAGGAQPARLSRRHPDPGRAGAGRRLARTSAPRCWPTH